MAFDGLIMIFNVIENADLYKSVHADVNMVLQFLKNVDVSAYQTGKVELDGDNVFLLSNEYETKKFESAKAEAHRKYIDVMYMVQGNALIYVKPTNKLDKIDKSYDEGCDAIITAVEADAFPVNLNEGCFVVLFPGDTHAPGCCVDVPKTVKKIIGKVKG